LGVEITHFGGNVHDIGIIWFGVFSGKVGVIDRSNTRWWTREGRVTGIFEVFESSGARETIRRKAEKMPAAVDTVGRSITNTADVGRMRTSSTRGEAARSGLVDGETGASTSGTGTRRTGARRRTTTVGRATAGAVSESSNVGSGNAGGRHEISNRCSRVMIEHSDVGAERRGARRNTSDVIVKGQAKALAEIETLKSKR
jgi:hypothetical protein